VSAKRSPQDVRDRRAEASESGLNAVLERNIETLAERRRHEALSASTEERIANAITRFTGTMVFVYAHLMLVGAWLYLNLVGVPGIARFDPSLVFLATFASVEAIFLSTFVLISQNRMTSAAEKRAELNVQIGLLTEHELTKVMVITRAIADKLHIRTHVDEEMQELQEEVAPQAVLDKLETIKQSADD